MYFATLLFWVTGIVAMIISLATEPGENYMVRNGSLRLIRYIQDKATLLD